MDQKWVEPGLGRVRVMLWRRRRFVRPRCAPHSVCCGPCVGSQTVLPPGPVRQAPRRGAQGFLVPVAQSSSGRGRGWGVWRDPLGAGAWAMAGRTVGCGQRSPKPPSQGTCLPVERDDGDVSCNPRRRKAGKMCGPFPLRRTQPRAFLYPHFSRSWWAPKVRFERLFFCTVSKRCSRPLGQKVAFNVRVSIFLTEISGCFRLP